MIVEIMGALIVLGALMVVLVRYQGSKRQDLTAEYQNMRDATEKLKRELERSGNAIIQRMGAHVTQLESLIREAEEQCEVLNRRMAEIQAVRQNIQQQLAEGHALQQQLLEQQRQCQQVYQQMEGLWVRGNAVPPAYDADRHAIRNVTASLAPSLEDSKATASFSRLLRESLTGDDGTAAWTKEDVEAPAVEQQAISPPATSEQKMSSDRETAMIDASFKEYVGVEGSVNDSLASRARLLLHEGHSVEEVSKETGMGRGAIELLRQMVQRQMETR